MQAKPYFSENEPPQFKENSEQLRFVLSEEELDFERFQSLVEERDRMVMEMLSSLTGEAKESFAQEELKTNFDLVAIAESLRQEQKNVLVNFVRSRKAAKKYSK